MIRCGFIPSFQFETRNAMWKTKVEQKYPLIQNLRFPGK